MPAVKKKRVKKKKIIIIIKKMKNFAKIIVLSQSRSDLSDGRLFIFCCWVGINDAYRKCQQ